MIKGGLLTFKKLSYNNGNSTLPLSENIRPIFKQNNIIGYRFLLDAQQGLSLKDNCNILQNILNILGFTSHTQEKFIKVGKNKFRYKVDGLFDRGNNIKYPFGENNFSLEIGFIPIDTSIPVLNNVTNIDLDLDSYYDNNYITNINPQTFEKEENIFFLKQNKDINNYLALDLYLDNINEQILLGILRLFVFIHQSGLENLGIIVERLVHFEKDILSKDWIVGKEYGQVNFDYNVSGIRNAFPVSLYPESVWENCPTINLISDKIFSDEILNNRKITGINYNSKIEYYGLGDIVLRYDLTEINNINSAGNYSYVNISTETINTKYLNYIKSYNFLKDSINFNDSDFNVIDNSNILSIFQDRINNNVYEILLGCGGGKIKNNPETYRYFYVNDYIPNKYSNKIYDLPIKAKNILLKNNKLYNKKLFILTLLRRLSLAL